MQFNSVYFLFYFLPVFMAVYYISPAKLKNTCLLIGSALFYGFVVKWQVIPVTVLLAATVFTYFSGRLLVKEQYREIFWVMLVTMVLLLTFFKCYRGGALLPAGISFYLFQMAAYLISVYNGRMEPQNNIISYGSQILMFPKVLSGPLTDPKILAEECKERRVDADGIYAGLKLLILGLAMKVILANRIGGLWNQAAVVGYESISPVFAWMSLLAYAIKLYLDFWGYSLMAQGLGLMLGFRLPKNFDNPYASRSVSEFYRRWHISLGAWFRDYIYIPLGGNRNGLVRTILNLLFVWTLTGLWHGVGGNYLLWAGILVLFVILERMWLGKFLNKSKVLCHIYTTVIILLSWVPFAIGDWSQMWAFLGRMFGVTGVTINASDYVYWFYKYAFMLVAGVALMTPLPSAIWKRIENSWIADVLCFVLFWISVYYIATAAQDPFMYFQY